MRAMPKLWRVLVTDLALDASTSWSLWAALNRARWSVAVAWREAFVAFAGRPQWTSAEEVEAFFRERVTLPQLMTVVETLRHEGVLLARDGHRLEEHLLQRGNAEGEWKHVHGQPRPERSTR